MKYLLVFIAIQLTGCAHYSQSEMSGITSAVTNDDPSALKANLKHGFNSGFPLVGGRYKDNDSERLVDIAASAKADGQCRSPEILRALIKAEAEVNCSSAYTAASNGCSKQLEIILRAKEKECLNATASYIHSDLHRRSEPITRQYLSTIAVVKSLLDSNCKKNVPDTCFNRKEIDIALKKAGERILAAKNEAEELRIAQEREKRDEERQRKAEVQAEAERDTPKGISKEICSNTAWLKRWNLELDRENRISKKTGVTNIDYRYKIGATIDGTEQVIADLQDKYKSKTGGVYDVNRCDEIKAAH